MERAQSTGDLRCSGSKQHTLQTPSKRSQKRKRRHSSEADRAKTHGRHGRSHRPPPAKKAKLLVSSTRVANNVMKFRLGGSVSDPLNLEGAGYDVDRECSTCAPSPALESAGQPSPLPPQLHRDPLNLEGKVKDFPHCKSRDKHSGEIYAAVITSSDNVITLQWKFLMRFLIVVCVQVRSMVVLGNIRKGLDGGRCHKERGSWRGWRRGRGRETEKL